MIENNAPNDESDARLLLAVADGERDAMRRCIDRFAPLVWKIVSRSLPNDSASDVVQDTFVSLWRSIRSFDSSRGRAVTFVALLARRRLVDHQRRRTYEPVDSLDFEPVCELRTSQNEIEFAETGQVLMDELRKLPPPKPLILRMAFYDGDSHATIAKKLNLPLGTVKSHVSRGLAKIKTALSQSNSAKESTARGGLS